MSGNVPVDKESLEFLERKIREGSGFVGVRLDEETIQVLERKFREQGQDLRIFWMVAADKNGDQVVVVPEQRADAKTFLTAKLLWDAVGCIKIEEVENISIVRLAGHPQSVVLDPPTRKPPDADYCIPCNTHIWGRS